jgi:glycerol-3-phosphate O-acyltransferase
MFEHLRAENIIAGEDGVITVDEAGADVLRYHAKIIQEYFESYYIVLHTILNQRVRKTGRKDFIADIRRAGVRLYHTGEVRLSESLSMPNYENAVRRLGDDGILVQKGASPKNAEISMVDKERALALFDFVRTCLEVIA